MTIDELERVIGLVKLHEIDRLSMGDVTIVNSRHNRVTADEKQEVLVASDPDTDLFWSSST